MKPVLRSIVLVAAIAGIYCCSNVQAEIRAGTADGFGVGSLTIDTDTGLEWLDWTESTGRSFAEIITLFDVGGDFEGFRHATDVEVRTLFGNEDIGLSTDNFPMDTFENDNGASARRAMDLLGVTVPAASQSFATIAPGTTTIIIGDVGDSLLRTLAGVQPAQAGLGHALVRSTAVPEPTSLSLLLGLGLVGLTGRRRIQ